MAMSRAWELHALPFAIRRHSTGLSALQSMMARVPQSRLDESQGLLELPPILADLWRVGVYDSKCKLHVRQCYDPLLAEIVKHNEKAGATRPISGTVVVGNPGIGKTGFLLYSLWRLLQDGRDVVLKVTTSCHYFCFTWSSGELRVALVSSGEEALWKMNPNPNPWFLADRYVPESDWACRFRFLLTCSPRKDYYHEFSNCGSIVTVYHPVWTLEELQCLNRNVFKLPAEVVEARFEKWGGIPRYVLDCVDVASQRSLEEAIGLIKSPDEWKTLPEESESDQSCKVFHMHVNEGSYSNYSLRFASEYVAGLVYSQLPKWELSNLFLAAKPRREMSDVQGKLFEIHLVNSLMLQGLPFQCRRLEQDGGFSMEVEAGKLVKPSVKVLLACKGKEGTSGATFPEVPREKMDALFVAISSENKEWDFIHMGKVYQSTLFPEGVLGDGVEDAINFLRKHDKDNMPVDFNFVVPECVLPNFKIDWFASRDDDALVKRTSHSKTNLDAERAQIMRAKMDRLKKLNITVKVVAFSFTDGDQVCPGCLGLGMIEKRNKWMEILRSCRIFNLFM